MESDLQTENAISRTEARNEWEKPIRVLDGTSTCLTALMRAAFFWALSLTQLRHAGDSPAPRRL
jgi:hypothetical protein